VAAGAQLTLAQMARDDFNIAPRGWHYFIIAANANSP